MISFQNVYFRYGAHDILRNVSFLVREDDKIGLIGRNGAGKTTLFELIKGNLTPQDGIIEKPKNVKIGYLPQHIKHNDTTILINEVQKAFKDIISLKERLKELHKNIENTKDTKEAEKILIEINNINDILHYNNYETINEQIEQVLIGLGFVRSDFHRFTKEFSGGWRMRVELAKLLLQKPDVLLLDEPTNHLDIESIQWLEDYLIRYNGAVMVVSHDIAFLNHITKRTIEIVNTRIYDYQMSYSDFVKFRQSQIEIQKQSFQNQQKQIEQTERFIERFRYKATKARQVLSKIKFLEKLERVEIDEFDTKEINLFFPPATHSGTIVCEAKELSKSFGSLQVLKNIDFTIKRGEKIALLGKNGEGKTTLVKIINQEIQADGYIRLGHNVKIGYFAQNQDEVLNLNITILETLENVAPIEVRPKLRKILGYFLFSDDDVFKKVSVLSGGERARLLLAKLLLEPVNFLLLDEPTNHLDVPSKNILKEAIKNYNGTVLLITHDRDFLDGLVDKILEIKEGKIKEYDGDVWNFLKIKKSQSFLSLYNVNAKNKETINKNQNNNIGYFEKKELDKKIRKIENQINKIEQSLIELEKKIFDCELQISQNNVELITDYKWYSQYEKMKDEYNKLYDELDKMLIEKETLIKEKQNKLL